MTPDDVTWRSRRITRDAISTAVGAVIGVAYFAMMGVPAGPAGVILAGSLSGVIVAIAGVRDHTRKVRSLAIDTLNTSYNLISLGRLLDAELLLEALEKRARFVWIARLVDIQAAIIAVRRGDLQAASDRLDAALGRPLGAFARENALQQIEGAHALRALVRAGLGRPDAAREDIEAVRARPAPGDDALAKAALAEAMILERAGRRDELRALLERERELLLEHTHPRERAIVRAFQRMLRAQTGSVYRRVAARDQEEPQREEPELADWVARVAPGAAPFVRAPRREAQATGAAVQAAMSAPAVPEQARLAVINARTGASTRRRISPRAVVTAIGLGALALFLSGKAILMLGAAAGAAGASSAPAAGSPAAWMPVAFVVAVVAAVVVLLSRRFGKRGLPDPPAPRAAESPAPDARAAARPSRRPDERALLAIAERGHDVEAAQARLLLALAAERRADFAAALEQTRLGLERLAEPRSRAAADILYPDLVSLRAFALAARGRCGEAEAELATLGAGYPHHARAVFRARLLRFVREGQLALAGAWVEQGAADLPLSVREELLADLARAAAAPEQAGAGEQQRIRDELRADPDLRRWIEVAAPGLIQAFEGGGAAEAGAGAGADADAEAEAEAAAVAEAEAAAVAVARIG